MASVTLEDVMKIYPGDVVAVERTRLKIQDREFMVLVGPSGCGKTTTLRMIAGLEELTEGTICIGERVVNDVLPKDRNIAMVFQNYAIYPHMSVYENLAFGLRQRRFPKTEIDQRVREAARVLGIDQLLARRPKALSGGQRQRVAVGRAIVRQPEVFLFDEPLSNLDAKMRVEMRKELKLLHQRLQTTIIYVTHDQIEAMTLGDRVCVMHEGKIEQVGAPIEVYDYPKSHFVAAFIGTPPMNFLSGELVDTAGVPRFAGRGFEVALPSRFKDAATAGNGRKIELGIRPEDLNHDAPDSTAGANIQGVVQLAEALGNEQLIYVKCGDASIIVRCEAHIQVKPGDELKLLPAAEKIHLFDVESGRNIIHG